MVLYVAVLSKKKTHTHTPVGQFFILKAVSSEKIVFTIYLQYSIKSKRWALQVDLLEIDQPEQKPAPPRHTRAESYNGSAIGIYNSYNNSIGTSLQSSKACSSRP